MAFPGPQHKGRLLTPLTVASQATLWPALAGFYAQASTTFTMY